MTGRRWKMVALVAAALTLGGCGSGDKPAAEAPAVTRPTTTTTEADPVANVVEREAAVNALRQQFEFIERAQWPDLWGALHPAQQALVDEASFATCALRRWGRALDVREVHVAKISRGTHAVAGTSEQGLGFRLEIRVVGQDPSGPFDATATYDEFKVGDGWRWAVRDPGAYQAGQCPADDDTLR